MSVHSYLYEKLVFYRGYLILPFQCGTISGADIYSYQLLCAFERRGKFHKAVNPAERYTDSIEAVVVIAQDFLDIHSDLLATSVYEQQRYVYQGNLILISQIAEKFFYDHYPPDQLINLAAPRLFESEADCITWVKQGIDRLHNASVTS
jgi:hypothetical protein